MVTSNLGMAFSIGRFHGLHFETDI